jgi:Cu2+-exporting ATPase
VLARAGIILSPALGAVLMSLSTVIVAVNAQLLGRRGVAADASPGDPTDARP